MVEVPFKREKDRKKFEKQEAKFDEQIRQYAEKNPTHLSPEIIVAVKNLLKDDRDLQSDVVAAHLYRMLVLGRLERLEDPQTGDPDEAELLRNPRVVHMIQQAAYLGSNWQQGLSIGIAAPDAEWPVGHSTPDWVAGAIAQNDIQKRNADIVAGNPKLDWTEHERLMSVVYGGVRALMDRYWEMPEDKNGGEDS